MPRRSSALPILAGLLLLVLVLALVLTAVSPLLPGFPSSIFGIRLREEVSPPQVLYASSISLTRGSVLDVVLSVHGIELVNTGRQLVERLNLSGVDVSVNDVIAPHLFDWYFATASDYVLVPNHASLNPASAITVEGGVKTVYLGTQMTTFLVHKYGQYWLAFGHSLEEYLRLVLGGNTIPVYNYIPVSYTHLTLPTNREV